MKWIKVAGITVCVVLIVLYEWPKMDRNQKREKAAFVTLSMMGWLLAILLLFFPDMPGPTQMIEKVFEPLRKMIQKK
jgi:hypothetical protein